MQAIVLQKTAFGAVALKTRNPILPQRLRAAFILFDGHKTVEQVTAMMPASGPGALSADDVQALLQLGLLVNANSIQVEDVSAEVAVEAVAEPMDPSQSYLRAYPLACALAAELGLRGFRLQLAVEKAQGYDGLVALLPKLREAITADKLRPLEALLQEHGAAR